jgi:predicted short-subunit dehydrogenase-like oxidoreductase (DUF2520 family)
MKIAIIGAGKVGIVLGCVLRRKGFDVVAMASRRASSLETARRYIGEGPLYTTDNGEAASRGDVVAVTTQDRGIRQVASRLAAENGQFDGKLFFHTSGAHTSEELAPLDEKGALLGSLHPLQTFPDIDAAIAALPQTYIFIEGEEKALPVLELLATHIGARAVVIAREHKVLYHLSAVFVCNLLSALLYAGEDVMERIGIGLEPFFPIIGATLRNIEAKGPLASLTGPVARGDAGTVASHLAALTGMPLHGDVYRSLSLVALDMARKRGAVTHEQEEAIRALLAT